MEGNMTLREIHLHIIHANKSYRHKGDNGNTLIQKQSDSKECFRIMLTKIELGKSFVALYLQNHLHWFHINSYEKLVSIAYSFSADITLILVKHTLSLSLPEHHYKFLSYAGHEVRS